MFITTKTHQAAIREKDEVIADIQERRLKAKQIIEQIENLNIKMRRQIRDLEDEIEALKARLAPFERTRGKGGRFVKKGNQ